MNPAQRCSANLIVKSDMRPSAQLHVQEYLGGTWQMFRRRRTGGPMSSVARLNRVKIKRLDISQGVVYALAGQTCGRRQHFRSRNVHWVSHSGTVYGL